MFYIFKGIRKASVRALVHSLQFRSSFLSTNYNCLGVNLLSYKALVKWHSGLNETRAIRLPSLWHFCVLHLHMHSIWAICQIGLKTSECLSVLDRAVLCIVISLTNKYGYKICTYHAHCYTAQCQSSSYHLPSVAQYINNI